MIDWYKLCAWVAIVAVCAYVWAMVAVAVLS